ncbi:MAG: MFS transporter [Alphaproteobacteria bacterium]|nr:MFS transporter [Alphaproteobacteria bacterium]
MPLGLTRTSLVFSSIGHFYIHLFTAFYAVIVVTMADAQLWRMSYEELLQLWTLGALLLGVCAIPAGRLSDSWGAPFMMMIFFIGMGVSSIACGFADTPSFLVGSLAGIGLFASIYHPVGIPWLIRMAKADAVGKMLAINGVFGSFGTAAAGILTGALIDGVGWRSAFYAPGVVSLVTGLVMAWFLLRGKLAETKLHAEQPKNAHSRSDMFRVFAILLVSMSVGGIIYHVLQIALPKLFSERLQDFLGDGALGVGAVFSSVFFLGGVMQIIGGFLADRFPLKTIYIVCWCLQIFVLSAIAAAADIGTVAFATLAVMVNVASLPAENMLLASYTPPRRHGLAFGVKFVLAFIAAPISIQLVAWVRFLTGDFTWLFAGLGVATAIVFVILFALPQEGVRRPVAMSSGAE